MAKPISHLIFPLLLLMVTSLCIISSSSTKRSEVGVYELHKGNFSVKFTNLGATLMSLVIPDKHGRLADVVLGFDSAEEYQNDTTYFGALVGRVANRIGGAQFSLNGVHYKLDANEGKNMLHGGKMGFSRRIWNVERYSPKGHSPYITFSYYSRDGEEGFPGGLNVSVTYKISKHYEMLVAMKAKATNKPTPVNLAQHTYWNLRGHNSGNILSHKVQIFGSQITPVDKHLIPTGKFENVKGTPYDFLMYPHAVGSRINKLPNGYDINYVLINPSRSRSWSWSKLNLAATVEDHEVSGRRMELWTNAPGLQFYTSNLLYHVKGKGGAVYNTHAALCLETQDFPDAVNHPNFPSEIVNPGQIYNHFMLFNFSIC